MRWVRPALTTEASSASWRPSACARWARAGASRSCTASTAARRIAVGKVSLLDCPALTWSLGCTASPERRWASRATTSLTFMFVDVPDPVWKTSTGKCPSWAPAATSSAAVATASASAGSSTPASALTRAAAALTRARAWMISGGMPSPEIGKFSTARAVWAPHRASAGTRTSPIESCSTRSVMGPSSPRRLRSAAPSSELAQADPPDAVVLALGEDQRGPPPGGPDVLGQVGGVDGVPDPLGGGAGLLVGERGIPVEVGVGVGEGGAAQAEEAVDVPPLDVLGAGVDVDREVEEVADRQAGAAVRQHPRRLEHVEALDDEHVGAADQGPGAGDDVVGQVRIDRGGDLLHARLDLGHEPEQRPAVVGLGEALALQQPPALELGVGVEETVGRDELDPRGAGPAAEELAQDPGGRGLAHGDRAGDADEERRALGLLAQEVGGDPVQAGGGADVEVEQPRDRQVDLLDLLEVEPVPEPAQAGDVGFAQAQGVLVAQPGPRRTVELDVGGGQAVAMGMGHGAHSGRAVRRALPGWGSA